MTKQWTAHLNLIDYLPDSVSEIHGNGRSDLEDLALPEPP